MKTIITLFQVLASIGAIGIFFIGIFKPSLFLKKKFKGRRLLLVFLSFVMFVLLGMLESYKVDYIYTDEEREQYYAERREQAIQDSIRRENKQREKFVRDSIKLVKKEQERLVRASIKLAKKQQKESSGNKERPAEENTHTITISIDTALVICYKHQFDSLYNVIVEIDKGKRESKDLVSCHKKIRDLLEEWLNTMDKLDPDDKGLPLSTNAWTKATDRYYNLARKFNLYGDGDIFNIRFWAKDDAGVALRRVLHNPGSLKIDSDDIQVYKTTQGWKCIVPYRAKNGFGAYVLESVTLIMNYDVAESRYKAVDIY